MWELASVYSGASHTSVLSPPGLVTPPIWRGWNVHFSRWATSFRSQRPFTKGTPALWKCKRTSPKRKLPMDRCRLTLNFEHYDYFINVYIAAMSGSPDSRLPICLNGTGSVEILKKRTHYFWPGKKRNLASHWCDEWPSEKICHSALYTVKWFINIRDEIRLDRVGRGKPPVKSCYLKVKIRSVCIPWAHTSWEIAQGIPRWMLSQLGLTRSSVDWIHLYVDISGLTRSA